MSRSYLAAILTRDRLWALIACTLPERLGQLDAFTEHALGNEAGQAQLLPWIATVKPHYVRIRPMSVTDREFTAA